MNTLFIVDDHIAIRTAYRQFFDSKPDISVVGEAADGREALDKIPNRNPQLALVDIAMHEMDGLELTRQLKAILPELSILIISSRDESIWAEKALEAGADGYLSKQRFEDDVLAAIDHLLKGHTYLHNPSLQPEIRTA